MNHKAWHLQECCFYIPFVLEIDIPQGSQVELPFGIGKPEFEAEH